MKIMWIFGTTLYPKMSELEEQLAGWVPAWNSKEQGKCLPACLRLLGRARLTELANSTVKDQAGLGCEGRAHLTTRKSHVAWARSYYFLHLCLVFTRAAVLCFLVLWDSSRSKCENRRSGREILLRINHFPVFLLPWVMCTWLYLDVFWGLWNHRYLLVGSCSLRCFTETVFCSCPNRAATTAFKSNFSRENALFHGRNVLHEHSLVSSVKVWKKERK